MIARRRLHRAAFVAAGVYNIVWWVPFALYLHDAWPAYRRGARGGPPIERGRPLAAAER